MKLNREETERFYKKINKAPRDIPTLEELFKKCKAATEPEPSKEVPEKALENNETKLS